MPIDMAMTLNGNTRQSTRDESLPVLIEMHEEQFFCLLVKTLHYIVEYFTDTDNGQIL